jgi:hypothetical protein
LNREDFKDKSLDRSSWKPGPWDNEPDFIEWTTRAGYPAWGGRLPSGAWFGIIEAPYPKEYGQQFHHTMRDKYEGKITFGPGMVMKTEKEDISAYVLSMEHWESPGPAYGGRDWNRGPYKTLDDMKEICEIVANTILETHQEGQYVHYFD